MWFKVFLKTGYFRTFDGNFKRIIRLDFKKLVNVIQYPVKANFHTNY